MTGGSRGSVEPAWMVPRENGLLRVVQSETCFAPGVGGSVAIAPYQLLAQGFIGNVTYWGSCRTQES